MNLEQKFFVSCQALKNEPMYGYTTMLKMATAAVENGAHGIRTSEIYNINKIKEKYPNIPVIGLLKRDYPNCSVYITPTIKELKSLIATKAEFIALDVTSRKRPKEDLSEIVKYFNKYRKPYQHLLADIANYDDAKNAIKLGIKYISTTLRGYTEDTKSNSNVENDYEFLKRIIELCKKNNCVSIAEGGFNDLSDVEEAVKLGSDIVVVGSAITRPQFITSRFVEAFKKGLIEKNK